MVATALALATGASAAAQTASSDVSRTGVFETPLARQEIPRVVRTGLGDMTTGAPQRTATRTPDRTPSCSSPRPFSWPRP
jgi:hypothetical protein